MRILQLIDTLNAGGSERVAVNYANALTNATEASHICATRFEGILKSQINNDVKYLFLKKKSTLDIWSVFRLVTYIKKYDISIIHAHSSSFFLAVIVKFFAWNIKVVWHDHYGNSEFLDQRSRTVLSLFSRFFSHIIVVNTPLKTWAVKHLKCKKVTYLANFGVADTIKGENLTELTGVDGKRIVCLANLRPQKDHLNLINAFAMFQKKYPDWTLHLVGKNFGDSYALEVTKEIENLNLVDKIALYGSRPDVSNILQQCSIGVLSSLSEGLPIALLEYGLAKLAIVSTRVGEIPEVITDEKDGFLVAPSNPGILAQKLEVLVLDQEQRSYMASNLYEKVLEHYSETAIIKRLLQLYKSII